MHEVRARCLALGYQPMDYLGWIFFGGTRLATLADKKRLSALEPGIDRLRDLCGDDLHLLKVMDDPRFLVIEEKLHFEDPFLRDVYGTMDFGAYLRSSTGLANVIISDLKFGQGLAVYAEGNEQQLIYALLLLDTLTKAERRRIEHIRIIIDQPRIADAGGEWVITPDFLYRWRDEVLYPGVEGVNSRNPKYAPGVKTCYWCKARINCVAYQEFNIATLGVQFDDERDGANFATAGIAALSPERRAYLARHKGMIEKFLEIVEGSVLSDALAGSPTPQMKAILGNQGKRNWVNPELALKALTPLLGEKATTTEVISPTVAADLLPKKLMEGLSGLITREPAKPKLVTLDNPKPAYVPVKMEDERAEANG